MQRFDCLDRNCPLFGPHLLEASAGTGKTFSIEHIYVRLILESVEVEQILAVTFTRAATRELKMRIRANLEKALGLIQAKEPLWDYLHLYLESEEAVQRLTDAHAGFDQCQIFTIHGFCYRMLKEFAFEAGVGLIADPDEGKKIPQILRQAAIDFLENGIHANLLCPEQITWLLREFTSIEEIADRLLKGEKKTTSDSFSELFAKCKTALQTWQLEEAKLLEDFFAVEGGYKVAVKGNFEAQVRGLANPEYFPMLLKEKGTLFDFLDPLNRKIRAKPPSFLHYPGFFDWARLHIAPIVKQEVFPILQAAWHPVAEKILAQEEYFDSDAILEQMKRAMENEPFIHCVRQRYAAVIVDEFQDTDVVQWDIFQRLFLEKSLRALYFVGDPKQSIYRFRKADIYTYFKARDSLGEKHLYQLDTNFRASKPLVQALNALFARDWLHLPKLQRSLPYLPVRAGSQVDADFPDEKGALHFFFAEGAPNVLFDTVFLPFIAGEIEKLSLKKCALLVKDRYQLEKALNFLKKRGIAAIAKSQIPLGKTLAFQAICELFEAILNPRDLNAVKIAVAGPFVKGDPIFSEYKVLLEEKGLVPLARKLDLDSDAMQIFERLFAWEKEEGFSFGGLKRFLKRLEELDPEEGCCRIEENGAAVQIMTLHASKGLEFDVVFALGLAARTPEGDEEIDAEKLRQLYVAMTRAKKRLYVPVAICKEEPDARTHSPMELFSRYFQGSLLGQLETFCKTESITFETISEPLILEPVSQKPFEEVAPVPLTALRPISPSFLYSFTALAQTQEVEMGKPESGTDLFTLQTMPRGIETGVAIHQIFETLFSSRTPIWRDPIAIDNLVAQQLRFSPLALWLETIQDMVRRVIATPLQADGPWFTLSEIEAFQTEVEFVFPSPPHFIKGFIDLVFSAYGKIYFLDWKTHWLEDYSRTSLQKVMQVHDYGLQAELYAEAIQRHFKMEFGGAFYFFVRGITYLFGRGEGWN